MHHGTTEQHLTIVDGMDICLVDSPDIAIEYAERFGRGTVTVFAVTLGAGRVASESDVWDVAAEIDGVDSMDHYSESDWRRQYVYELVDRDDVREALADAGFDAVEYADLAPDNSCTHTTLRVWSAAMIAGVARTEI